MSVTTARRAGEQSVTAYQNLIGGEWQHASDSRTLDMISPSDGQAFARIARGTKADVDGLKVAKETGCHARWWQHGGVTEFLLPFPFSIFPFCPKLKPVKSP